MFVLATLAKFESQSGCIDFTVGQAALIYIVLDAKILLFEWLNLTRPLINAYDPKLGEVGDPTHGAHNRISMILLERHNDSLSNILFWLTLLVSKER
jgi:hypothetical protein